MAIVCCKLRAGGKNYSIEASRLLTLEGCTNTPALERCFDPIKILGVRIVKELNSRLFCVLRSLRCLDGKSRDKLNCGPELTL